MSQVNDASQCTRSPGGSWRSTSFCCCMCMYMQLCILEGLVSSYRGQVWWVLQKLMSQLPRSAVNIGSIKCAGLRNGDWGQALLVAHCVRAIKKISAVVGV